jgi:hypothetical protein
MDRADLIDRIKIKHRRRVFMMELRKRIDLELGSLLRIEMGWRRADELEGDEKKKQKAANAAIRERAQEMIEIADRHVRAFEKSVNQAKRKDLPLPVEPPPPEELGDLGDFVVATVRSRIPSDSAEALATREMEQLAKDLPVWLWAEPIRGLGPVGLATIIAEAGRDISEYRSVAALWTRMGVGIRDGVRQGGLPKNAPKEDWILHGYSPRRRSRMWNVGHALVLSNGDGKYRQAYLARKEYERDKAESEGLIVVPAAKIPKGKLGYRSVGHIDRRAQRYMEKMLLRDLWVEWRRVTKLSVQPEAVLSPPLDPEDMAAD